MFCPVAARLEELVHKINELARRSDERRLPEIANQVNRLVIVGGFSHGVFPKWTQPNGLLCHHIVAQASGIWSGDIVS